MTSAIESAFQKGATFEALLKKLAGAQESGKALSFEVDDRSGPYLNHRLVGWTDGPPTSVVAWVMSGEDPAGHAWRRFTFSKVGPGRYKLACFPTPFHNGVDPLSPGIPPSSSRAAKAH